MKKNKKKNKYIFILIIIVIIFFISIFLKEERKLFSFEKVIKDSFYKIFSFNQNKYEVIISDESLNAYNLELNKQIKELKKTLELNTILSDYKTINASIINRDIMYWYDTLILDKGKKDGIDIDMAVINDKGLIGRVVNISDNTCVVKLLSSANSNNKISIKINNEDTSLYGLLSDYDEKRNLFIIEGISENVEIKEGQLVTTSGLSEIFPSGILIGTVHNVTTDNYDLTKTIEVTPSVNYNDLNYVVLLNRK